MEKRIGSKYRNICVSIFLDLESEQSWEKRLRGSKWGSRHLPFTRHKALNWSIPRVRSRSTIKLLISPPLYFFFFCFNLSCRTVKLWVGSHQFDTYLVLNRWNPMINYYSWYWWFIHLEVSSSEIKSKETNLRNIAFIIFKFVSICNKLMTKISPFLSSVDHF